MLSAFLLALHAPDSASAFIVILSAGNTAVVPTVSSNRQHFRSTHPSFATSRQQHPPQGSSRRLSRGDGDPGGKSPFDASEYSEEDANRREAEELERLVHGRRGIVLEMVEREWKEALERTIEAKGERLCAEAYEGYGTKGRGCLFVSFLLVCLYVLQCLTLFVFG